MKLSLATQAEVESSRQVQSLTICLERSAELLQLRSDQKQALEALCRRIGGADRAGSPKADVSSGPPRSAIPARLLPFSLRIVRHLSKLCRWAPPWAGPFSRSIFAASSSPQSRATWKVEQHPEGKSRQSRRLLARAIPCSPRCPLDTCDTQNFSRM